MEEINLITRTTGLAMSVTLSYIDKGDTVIDATCGAGQDTVALANAAGRDGCVYAFDIQEEAIRRTKDRLRENGLSNVRVLKESFTSVNDFVPEGSASAAVFNLGYLPGGDHSITTTADETLEGLACALRTLRPGGILTVVMYDGHDEGRTEKQRVMEWAKALDPKQYHAAYVNMLNQRSDPPEILWITKKKNGVRPR
ncbi:MAG: class I SAM-dependent methyltransferase [Mogibacterium sp.]|nr:class I SAM-dependent methyltransferase [Mogibacterium sp.]